MSWYSRIIIFCYVFFAFELGLYAATGSWLNIYIGAGPGALFFVYMVIITLIDQYKFIRSCINDE